MIDIQLTITAILVIGGGWLTYKDMKFWDKWEDYDEQE